MIDRTPEYLQRLLPELLRLPQETEWVEFKHNNGDAPLSGEYISALANSAALLGKQTAYLLWGVDNDSHEVVGTNFRPTSTRYKNQELESWLLQKLSPKIEFRFFEFSSQTEDGLPVVLLEIQPATHTPVLFDGVEYIRVGSYKKRLRQFPEKERELWRVFDRVPFEAQLAAEEQTAEQVLKLLDYPTYFELTDTPLPENRDGILAALQADSLITGSTAGRWHITNLGAVLFARNLQDFSNLRRKAVRVVQYSGDSKVETLREFDSKKGYAVGFEALIEFINNLLPQNEVIGAAFRREIRMYPELAIRELVANALIHQDFFLSGTGPMIELFDQRLEITNPGVPLVEVNRFLDSPPRSRNEALAAFMRRIDICEERGSGIDKVVSQVEFYQLPAPLFEQTEEHTRSILFAHRPLKEMDRAERSRACYWHCCLRYVNRQVTNNSSVRERFAIEEQNKAQASKLLREAVQDGWLRVHDPNAGPTVRHYVPSWA